MRSEQTVSEIVEEVLARQAKALLKQTGQPLEAALEAVYKTDAGRQLRELANGEHRDERAREWQVGLALKRAEERHYSWLEGYMERLESKEARAEYYTLLEELASLRG
jgi:DNA-binding SARP family transcriptional activator